MKEVMRKFLPGSEWLYIKFYTGIKTADLILEEAVKPLLKELQAKDLIEKWFFIRYSDPKPHLRIRFEISHLDSFEEVFSLVKDYLQEYLNSGEISDFILDTYRREIERYGETTIQDAEFLFWKNSECTLYDYLHFDDEEKIIMSLYYIDQLLDHLGLSVPEKLEWIKESNLAFKQEFNADKILTSQLNKKYLLIIPKYYEFIESDDFSIHRENTINSITDSAEVIKNIQNRYAGTLKSFFQSIFHMNINRIFVSQQRLFEMIIYDYLFRYYKTLAFKGVSRFRSL